MGSQVRAAGVEVTLDGLFKVTQESFIPEGAKGVDAVIQYIITDENQERPYTMTIKDSTCTLKKEKAVARVTIRTDLFTFLKLMGGAENGMQLYMTGKLKIEGDLMFTQQLAAFFKAT
jgi:putative sterol carrier protein